MWHCCVKMVRKIVSNGLAWCHNTASTPSLARLAGCRRSPDPIDKVVCFTILRGYRSDFYICHSTIEDSSNLCLVCKNLFGEMRSIIEERPSPPGFIKVPDLTQEHSYVHHQHLSSLKNSVDEKCYICLPLWEFISDEAGNHNALDTLEYRCAISGKSLRMTGPTGSLQVLKMMNIWFRGQTPNRRPLQLVLKALLSTGKLVNLQFFEKQD
jgi:hypothetical protein